MEYRVSAEEWMAHGAELASHLRAGGRFAPLIVRRGEGRLVVSDGNHRLAALHTLGLPAAWVLIWSDLPSP
ncbi:ParB N-terminal domain-containing protein [Deinococcus apachensis]|uniref:ParB N-terminal domain-containing protein n=1 Tax=Deinococcus apachensis TaxID=309886 RepID=UPI0003731089|nr:ParB N-terminal domain-containing protein [Deinococcus apachensis]